MELGLDPFVERDDTDFGLLARAQHLYARWIDANLSKIARHLVDVHIDDAIGDGSSILNVDEDEIALSWIAHFGHLPLSYGSGSKSDFRTLCLAIDLLKADMRDDFTREHICQDLARPDGGQLVDISDKQDTNASPCFCKVIRYEDVRHGAFVDND